MAMSAPYPESDRSRAVQAEIAGLNQRAEVGDPAAHASLEEIFRGGRRGETESLNCAHGYRLTDSCPNCP